MPINLIIFLTFLSLHHEYVSAASDAEKLCILEKKMDVLEPVGIAAFVTLDSDRIASLEKRMEALEILCIGRSGMKRHCLVPDVLNGEAHCPEIIPPDSKCSVVCNPGYMATPSKETTMCKKDGFWTIDMECEIPLVIVSGGLTNQSKAEDSSIEVLSLYPSKGCDRQIPDMPLAAGTHRTLHNLIYLPNDGILACNGMTKKHKTTYHWEQPYYKASCDKWSLKTNTWKHNSYPNQGSRGEETLCEREKGSTGYYCTHPDHKKGRYATEGLNLGGTAYLLGGMVYDNSGHDPSNSIRSLYISRSSSYWSRQQRMSKRRSFFCAAKIKEGGALMIGGLGKNKNGTVVEKSVEFSIISGWGVGGLNQIYNVTDMNIPRSGHGCTAIPGGNYSVLVTGGTQGFGQSAMAHAEIFSWNYNSWTNIASMNTGRFGHAVVAAGDRVFAIGGDDRNNKNMDSIEEYDIKRNTWKVIKQTLKKPRSNFGFTLVPHSIFDGCVIDKPLDE